MESKDQDLYDETVFEVVLANIPDEMVELEHTKYGSIKLHRRGIFNMAARGASVRDIAQMFGVSEPTLYKHVGYEMKAGKAFISPRLKFNILKQAMREDKPNAAIMIFAAKNWTELTEDGMKGQEALEVPKFIVEPPVFEQPSALTDSEREEIEGEQDAA